LGGNGLITFVEWKEWKTLLTRSLTINHSIKTHSFSTALQS